MPHLVRDLGFELPVYDPDTEIVWDTAGLKNAEQLASKTLVRRARFRPLVGHTSLRQALKSADRAFESAADFCGALVLPHHWGLFKVSDNNQQYFSSKPVPQLLPDKHILVAEVAVLHEVKQLNKQQKLKVISNLQAYHAFSSSPEWGEANESQFVYAKLDDTDSRLLWLHDIEPLLDYDSVPNGVGIHHFDPSKHPK